jgi:hypothetical protein
MRGAVVVSTAIATLVACGRNTPPRLDAPALGDSTHTIPDNGIYGQQLRGTPFVLAFVADADGDPVTLDVEVVPRGQPFSGSPTHTRATVASERMQHCSGSTPCLEVPLTGLTLGQPYSFALRVRDQFSVGTQPYVCTPQDGWSRCPYWWFVQVE